MEEDINEKKQKYKNIEGISIESCNVYGDPYNKIVEYINDNIVDIMIIGSIGLYELVKIKGLGIVSKKSIIKCGLFHSNNKMTKWLLF